MLLLKGNVLFLYRNSQEVGLPAEPSAGFEISLLTWKPAQELDSAVCHVSKHLRQKAFVGQNLNGRKGQWHKVPSYPVKRSNVSFYLVCRPVDLQLATDSIN